MKKYLITILLLLSLLLAGCSKQTTLINDSISSKETLTLKTVEELKQEDAVSKILSVIKKEDITLNVEDLEVNVYCYSPNTTTEYTTITYMFNSDHTGMTLAEVSELQVIFNSLIEIYDQDNFTNKVYPVLVISFPDYEITIGDGGMGDAVYIEVYGGLTIEQYVLQNSEVITDLLNAGYTYKWLKFNLNDGILYLINYDIYGEETRIDYKCATFDCAGGNDIITVKETVEEILDDLTFFILN